MARMVGLDLGTTFTRIYTEDGGLSAQIEYMVLVTETGIEVLTK